MAQSIETDPFIYKDILECFEKHSCKRYSEMELKEYQFTWVADDIMKVVSVFINEHYRPI